ncbi:MAG: hypothetical protein C4576_23015 [Desulfobacteraceae bacterium]|nr:MAG: hypothetical protein C4576_23015 [Desulfobacteraceae bacterium]
MAQTETQTQGNPPANAGGTPSSSQGSDFDKLLNEFEQRKQPQPPEIPETIKPLVDWAASKRFEEEKETFEKDVSAAVGFMKEADSLKSLDEFLVRGALNVFAMENKEFDEAFKNRRQNPAAWNEARAKARETIAKRLTKESQGSDVRSDIEAATAAVRNSHSAPRNTSEASAEERLGWSDSTWEEHKARRRAGA